MPKCAVIRLLSAKNRVTETYDVSEYTYLNIYIDYNVVYVWCYILAMSSIVNVMLSGTAIIMIHIYELEQKYIAVEVL